MSKLRVMKNKKGFTLVEVIVVLVILAILAALLVPSMIGWIQKAEDKTTLVEARSALLALQTIASENYGDYTGTDAAETMTEDHITEAAALADVGGTITAVTIDQGKITGFTYTPGADSGGKAYSYTVDDGFVPAA